MHSFFKSLLFSFVALLFLPFFTAGNVHAQTDLPIEIIVTNPRVDSGEISASLQFKNPNNINLSNVIYTTRLNSQDKVQVEKIDGKDISKFISGELITDQTSDSFSLNANGTKTASLKLAYQKTLVSGKYDLMIAVLSNGVLLGSKTTEVDLNGEGSQLQINSCVLVVDNDEYSPTIGPNVAPKGIITAKCSVTNPASFAQTVTPSGEYAVDSVVGNKSNVVKYSSNTPITIEATSTDTLSFPLPQLDTPQVYEALISLNDSSGSSVSRKVAFRWVVAGESAKVRSISTDKTTYKSGETAKVVIGADPSMDLFWNGGGPTKPIVQGKPDQTTLSKPKQLGTPLKNPSILVTLKNGSGDICGTYEQKVDAKPEQNIWPDQTLNVPVTKDCDNVAVEAQVKNDGKVLATKETKLDAFAKNNSPASNNILALIIGLIIGVLLVLGGVLFWWMKKKGKNLPPAQPIATSIILFVGIGLMLTLAPTAKAAAQSIRVGHNEVIGYRPGQPCPGPVWLPNNPQPQGDDGNGGCLIGIVSSYSWTTFNKLDTDNEIRWENGQIKAHIAGQFVGQGCVNAQVGLVIRAYVNGSQNGVSINGAGPRIEFTNLAANGGGSGTPFDRNITINSTVNKCGPLDVKIEVIPFIDHAGRIASDPAEDRKLTDADVPGWHNITYVNRSNCGGQGPCFATLQKQVDAGACRQCNDPCTTQTDCNGVQNGCTVCRPSEATASAGQMTCQPGKQCNEPCNTPADCVGAQNGCSQCLPSRNGTGKTCQQKPQCGTVCRNPADCEGAENGCTNCLPDVANPTRNICSSTPQCGTPCVNPASCVGAQGGCTNCINNGSGPKCGSCPAGMNYDPTAQKCVCPNPGETNPHGVCDGDKCTNVNSCGVTECTTDKQCFAEEMCKCDGFDAVQLEYPSNKPFIFDAFAKIEGTDIQKAIVEGMQFKMSESDRSNPNAGTIIAQSPMYTPQIVSQDGSKVRYKATWNLTPPTIKANKTYRVFADIKCKPKNRRRTADAKDPYQYSSVAGVSTVNAQGNITAGEKDLQLKTLNLIKKGQTDKCRFLFFEYDAGLN